MQQNSDDTRSSRTKKRRRARRGPALIDTTVESPCLSVCRFDGEPYCVGCFRNADEIREWMIMTREQKLQVLSRLPERKRAAANETDIADID